MFCSATECLGSIMFGSRGQRFEFRGFKISNVFNITASEGEKGYEELKKQWDERMQHWIEQYRRDDESEGSW